MSTGRDAAALSREFEELDAIRRRVINVIGHALRTPVTTIAGLAGALDATSDEATRTVLVEGLMRNTRRLEALVDDLLLAAGVSTALPAGDPEPVAVLDALELTWCALDGAGEFSRNGTDVKAVVRVDAFHRVAHAVLDNAVKYGDGRVTVTASSAPSRVLVEIASVGTLPSDDELARAFEPFYRGEHAVMAAPGLGVGLPVARQIVHAEGGTIDLTRRDNAIVVTLDLPA